MKTVIVIWGVGVILGIVLYGLAWILYWKFHDKYLNGCPPCDLPEDLTERVICHDEEEE